MHVRISVTPEGPLVSLPGDRRSGLRSAADSPTGTIEFEGPWSDSVHFAVGLQMREMSASGPRVPKPRYAAKGLAGRGFIGRFQIRAGGGMPPRYTAELRMTAPPIRLGDSRFKRPRDPNERAFQIVREATGQTSQLELPEGDALRGSGVEGRVGPGRRRS